MPNSSPSAARTAGEVLTTTTFSGSATACRTAGLSSRSVMLSTGQTLAHWPQ